LEDFSLNLRRVKAIPHRLELTTILRQNTDDRNFIACLKEIRYGRCGEETLEFISSLSRDLSEELMQGAVHIFFKTVACSDFQSKHIVFFAGCFVYV